MAKLLASEVREGDKIRTENGDNHKVKSVAQNEPDMSMVVITTTCGCGPFAFSTKEYVEVTSAPTTKHRIAEFAASVISQVNDLRNLVEEAEENVEMNTMILKSLQQMDDEAGSW